MEQIWGDLLIPIPAELGWLLDIASVADWLFCRALCFLDMLNCPRCLLGNGEYVPGLTQSSALVSDFHLAKISINLENLPKGHFSSSNSEMEDE